VNFLAIQRSAGKLWQIDGSTAKGLSEDRDIGISSHRIDQSNGVSSTLYIGCIKREIRNWLSLFTDPKTVDLHLCTTQRV
jgi:hypothetical protein